MKNLCALMLWLTLCVGMSACSNTTPADAPQKTSAPDAKIVDDGRCEHGLTSAICTSCNPSLIAVFKSKGDWCETHDFPESLCPVCNPNLTLPDVGEPSAAASSDWCAGHDIPESMCTKCHPELVDGFKQSGDWCEEHGYPKSACPVHNPMTPPDVVSDWCVEHGLPESKCTVCSPDSAEQYKQSGDWCEDHNYPQSACPTCKPQRAPVGSILGKTEALSPEAIARSGIRLEKVREGRAGESIEVPAEVQLNPDRVAHVSPLMTGQLQSISVALGDRVEAGQELAVLRSVELGHTRASLKRADAMLDIADQHLKRQETLRKEGINAQRDVLNARQAQAQARADRDMARSHLQVFGVRGGRGADMTLTSPLGGIVVKRHATRGEHVNADDTLFVIADINKVWVVGHIYEQDISSIHEGMPATLSLSAYPGQRWSGKIDYVSKVLDDHTRSLPIRVELDNSTQSLRPGLFGTLTFSTTGTPDKSPIVVPANAIQRINDQPVVFVQGALAGEYLARAVAVGQTRDGNVDVIDGLSIHERVVVDGAFVLKSEIMRHALGEGCAH